MKLILAATLLFFFTNCSFDNKSNIWENADNTLENKRNNIFKDFKKISSSINYYNKNIPLNKDVILSTSNPIKNSSWNDIFYQKNNNFENFKYNDLNEIFFKSKKLSRYSLNEYKLYENGNSIFSDIKGNIIVYSIIDDTVVAKFNFYKKEYKKIKKKLNTIIENNIIFVADNLGYFYAYDFKNNEVIWAKNFKIPFSSNLKIFKNLIVVSNQSNNLYFINKSNGDLVKLIPTEETQIKNDFTNNLSMGNNNLFFLNSFGSLYSINLNKLSINWFNNYNQTLNISPANIFFGNTIVNNKDEIIISSNKSTFLVDLKTGSLIKKFNFSSVTKPIIIKDLVFLITRNNFLIAIDLESKKILYSLDLSKIKDIKIKNFSPNLFKEFMILNSKIFIFLNNSNILIFDISGEFIEVRKLKSEIQTSPIIIDESILYISKKNKLIVLN